MFEHFTLQDGLLLLGVLAVLVGLKVGIYFLFKRLIDADDQKNKNV